MKLQVLKFKHHFHQLSAYNLSKVNRKSTSDWWYLTTNLRWKTFFVIWWIGGAGTALIYQPGPPFGRSDELILANLDFLVRIVLFTVRHILNHISEIQDVWWSTVSKKIYPQIDHHHNASKTKTTKVLSPLFTMAVNTMFTLKNDPSKHRHHQSPWQR